MAEDTMATEQLTDRMIEAGASLTAKLDSSGLPVVAALWFLLPEVNEWRLFFASPEVSTQGPRSVYQKIQTAIDELGSDEGIPLSMIGVLDADADLVRLMKAAVRTGSGIAQIRFSKNVINGHFIDDALIYRAA